ncbi:MAG: HAD-IA family hydrolase [Acidobacteriota bacterium]
MPLPEWFIWDLGNVVLKLAWERVVTSLVASSSADAGAMKRLMEGPDGYRAMERGDVAFAELFSLLRERAGYRGGIADLREVWSDFFDGTVEGIVPLIERTRAIYRVAFLSNSNEVHEEVIPRQFPEVFRPDDPLILSHRQKAAKPDPLLFVQALEILGTTARQCIFVDDLRENVESALRLGFQAFQFIDTPSLVRTLEARSLLPPVDGPR